MAVHVGLVFPDPKILNEDTIYPLGHPLMRAPHDCETSLAYNQLSRVRRYAELSLILFPATRVLIPFVTSFRYQI